MMSGWRKEVLNFSPATMTSPKIAPMSASVFLIPAAITFAVYASTVSESIAGGDSGELVAEGCALGTSHPPGYPLYTIIVYFVTTMGKRICPSKLPAYLVNITSCVFGSISSGLMSLVVYTLTKRDGNANNLIRLSRIGVAISISLTCSFSTLMWQYNSTAEVFALHNLFVAWILYALVKYHEMPNSTFAIAVGSFICGIALTNQHTSILLILPVGGYVLCKSSIHLKPRLLLISTLSFVVGMSLYALLPILAMRRPHAGSWGDVTTIKGLVHHFLRRDYGTLRLYSGNDATSENVIARTFSWADDFISHQLCRQIMMLMSILGIVCGLQLLGDRAPSPLKKKLRAKQTANSSSDVWKLILFALAFYLVVFHSLSNLPLSNPLLYGIHARFWMHPNILVFVLIGIGVEKLIHIASHGSSSRMLASMIIVILLPVAQYHQNYGISDQSTNNYFRNYAMAVLAPLPSNSLILINYDQQWTSVRYLQECEGVRKDITAINLSMMTFEWWESKRELYDGVVKFPGTHYTRGNTQPWLNGGFTIVEFIDANIPTFGSKIYIGGRLNFEESAYTEKYEEQPFGLVRRIQTKNRSSQSLESYRLDSLRAWKIVAGNLSSDLPSETKYPLMTWESTIRREFFDHLVSRSTYLLDLAVRDTNQLSALQSIAEAAAWLELVQSWDIDTYGHHSSMKKNLGLAYMHIVRSRGIRFPVVEDIFNDGRDEHRRRWWKTDEGNSWKEWATHRWKSEWEMFLRLESSKSEPGYAEIKNIYDIVMRSSQAKENLQ